MNNLKKEIEKVIGDTTKAKANTWDKINNAPTKKRMPLIIMLSSTGILCFLLFIMYSSKFDGFNSQNSEPKSIEPNIVHGQQEEIEVAWKLYEEKKELPIYIEAQDAAILINNEHDYAYYSDLFQFQNTGGEINFANANMLIIMFNTNSCGLEAEEFLQKNGELQIKLKLPVNVSSQTCDHLSMPNVQLYTISKIDVQHVKLMKEEETISVPVNELNIQQEKYDFEMLYTNELVSATLTSINSTSPVEISNKQILQEIQGILIQSTKLPGIANMLVENRTIRINFKNVLGNSFSVFVWISEEYEEATIMSSRSTHTIYTLPKAMALQLLTLNGLENPFE